VGKVKTETIGMASIETVKFAKVSSYGLAYSLNVGAMMNTVVGMYQTAQIGVNKTTTVGTKYTLEVGAKPKPSGGGVPGTGMASNVVAPADGAAAAKPPEGSSIVMDKDSIKFKIGDSTLVMTKDSIVVTSSKIDIEGKKKVNVTSEDIDLDA